MSNGSAPIMAAHFPNHFYKVRFFVPSVNKSGGQLETPTGKESGITKMPIKKTSVDHLHRYRKVNLARNKGDEYLVYKCMKPLCSHYLPLILVEGKVCECNRCGEPMVITKYTLTSSGNKPQARPHCQTCTKSRKQDDVAALADFLNSPISRDET